MIDRRQFFGGSAALICGLGLAACGGNAASDDPAHKGSGDDAQKAKLIVFAAASMTESLTKAGDEFMAENQGYGLSFNYDSSGTLKTQIQEGADCDVFISAGQKQMNATHSTPRPRRTTTRASTSSTMPRASTSSRTRLPSSSPRATPRKSLTSMTWPSASSQARSC